MLKKFNTSDIFKINNLIIPEIENHISDDHQEFIAEMDNKYIFDPETLSVILAGFKYNKKVLLQGMHGTGKSSHIEQVAARLSWPIIRINLDSNITRTDLLGKDTIIIKDGQQITSFQDGLLIYALRNPIALIFDEYDAARPEIMFVLQRLLEQDGKITLLENSEVITPHPQFRLFATCNTIGFGDDTGIYHGVSPINQGQMDRWDIVHAMEYCNKERELEILVSKFPEYDNEKGRLTLIPIITLANIIRKAFRDNQVSSIISMRTAISWIENIQIFKCTEKAFKFSFYNKCSKDDQPVIKEFYQRVFAKEL